MTDSTIRRQVVFRGRVQGVGFRATVRDVARRFPIVGYVQNLSDGRVQLTVEGTPDELTQFVAAIEAEMQRYISGYEVDESPAKGEFDNFTIHH